MNIIKRLKKLYTRFEFALTQRTDENGVIYLWKRKHSDKLIIVFSGIGPAGFNYVKSLKNSLYDQLFIKDCWAGGVSYYWFENKKSHPEEFTQALIGRIIKKGKYKEIYTVGSSKGGSAALYYGFKNQVKLIYAGSCQYYVGDYLSRHQYESHPEQWEQAVGGKPSTEWKAILDNKIKDIITEHQGCSTRVKLFYSTEEHTYDDHIKPLIEQLDKCGIFHDDQIEKFPEHSMVGIYFRDIIAEYFSNLNSEENE